MNSKLLNISFFIRKITIRTVRHNISKCDTGMTKYKLLKQKKKKFTIDYTYRHIVMND